MIIHNCKVMHHWKLRRPSEITQAERKDRMGKTIIMYGTILWVCLGFLLTAGVDASQGPERETAAIAAAEQWLGLVDEGKYAESWTEAAGYFKNAVAQEQWGQSLKAIRNPLGKLISREVKN
jgi:hypothetical protein